MPLEKHFHLEPQGELGIWRRSEDLDFFQDQLTLHHEEKSEVEGLNDRKMIEWYSSRYLLHQMSGREDRGACLKDEYGKPYLVDSDHYISMSHSGDLVAVVASMYTCGIDIQYIVPKITRIARKFVNEQEESFLPDPDDPDFIKYLHMIWGAKECIYKAYGRRGLDLKKHMEIHPFKLSSSHKMNTTGSLNLEDRQRIFHIKGRLLNDYILVYALEVDEPILHHDASIMQE